MGTTKSVKKIFIMKIACPAVMDDNSSIAGDDAKKLDRFDPPLGVDKLQGDVAT